MSCDKFGKEYEDQILGFAEEINKQRSNGIRNVGEQLEQNYTANAMSFVSKYSDHMQEKIDLLEGIRKVDLEEIKRLESLIDDKDRDLEKIREDFAQAQKDLSEARKEICVSVAHHGFSFPVSEEQDISFDPADYATRRGWYNLYESAERQTVEE